jgi:ABC-2 type transport system permease protein
MRAFGKMALMQTKLYLREPMGVFFTLLFGPALLVMMGLIFGSKPMPELNGLSHMDISVPSYIGLVVGITALTTLPIGAASRRETGVLRRFAATPLRPLAYFLADILAPIIITVAGTGVLILVGLIGYQVRFDGQWLNVAAGIFLSTTAFFALGYAIGGIVPNARTAIVAGNVLIIPMNILSGALIPLEIMPGVQKISRFIPLTYVVSLLKGLWFGVNWSELLPEVAVLVGLLILATLIIALTFRWE